MYRVDGSLARKLEFADTMPEVRAVRPGYLRRLALLQGPDKYKVLERRRRAAQIRARRLLDLIDMQEQSERN
jgi:hypothetical protein